ncbi:exodeoxyribonuclease VII large subunit [Pandoraea morbifera]|uniref:Exodeoxyribonuclease 7 large subunit n=1 Tax=Pandoraea morbifera TaxID=2508300 RepID=A0A5E4WH84_9BURK|nr:exodeoxyribonuclease VII large subunit [Pandoraea morbifera]VVE22415.1 exodeoxyribonuclease VII large subunit [Pandoraea morbifera]
MNLSFDDARPTGGADRVLSVSDLNKAVAGVLERSFPLAWVSGEISNFTRAASGHWYFSIKDAQAQMRCVMFRGRAQHADFMPKEGDRVEVRALLSMYVPRGEVQLNVEAIRRAGQGNLYEAFLRLKEKLAAAGLFDTARKRALPKYARRVGVVTSLQAAALRDVLTTLARRAPHVAVVVYPAPVQGVDAAARLAAALDIANARREVDTILLCRGGGSIEDLWAFNEEVLAHAIARSELPVVSGVGHETDFTIADFVADVRAPTPTAAAELISAARDECLREVDRERQRLTRAMWRTLEQRAQQLDSLSRGLVSPRERLARQRGELAHLSDRMRHALERPLAQRRGRFEMLRLRLARAVPDIASQHERMALLGQRMQRAMLRRAERSAQRLADASAQLELLNPRRTLQRGYAAVLDAKGQPLRDPRRLQRGQQVTMHLAQGAADVGIGDVQVRLDDTF